jgi:2-keto-4-pentenoate hydratase/2-oxohepta-3-ene-1,7-dioic acid hydratase in catechol pathway
MRFVSFDDHDGTPRAGAVADDTIHPLPVGVTLLSLLGDDGTRLREAGERALAAATGTRPYAGTRLRAPIDTPPTVRDFMTFESHVEGTLKLAGPAAVVPPEWYDAPAFYFTNPYAVIGPYDDVPVPPGSDMFDLELEVAAIIGRGGRDVPVEEGESHVAGYTLLLDWSARDLQLREMNVRLGPAKGKDTATTLGPVLVTPDELEPFRSGSSFDLRMSASVNGREIGSDTLASMGFSFAEMVAHASRGTEVRPGDVLGSGTCGGGCLAELWGRQGLDAHPPLRPGDTVSTTVEHLGSLTSQIVAYPGAR